MGGVLALDPALPVLLRPDGAVQVGWDPRRAVQVVPPDGLSAAALAEVLRALPHPDVMRLAARHGLADGPGFEAMLAGLTAAGVLRDGAARRGGRALSIRVHGRGPLSGLLAEGLRCSGARVGQTSHPNVAGRAGGVDLVVLADALVEDPRLVRDLQSAGVAHLPVRVRDGTGLVGPLVIPGVTSCLRCADLHRTDRDPAWPALATQLREVVGTADRATLLATAALALGQLQRIIAAVRGGPVVPDPPATFDTTWELDLAGQSLRARRWSRHPLCRCWDTAAVMASRQE